MLDLNIQPAGQAFSLYLKSFPERYSVVQVNTLPTVVSAINIVSALIAGITADRLGRFWVPALVTTIPVLVGMILLNVWHVGFGGRLAAFMLVGFMARMCLSSASSFLLTRV
jgi:ACS family pantothenate transporter-like MFS transporter